MIQVFLYFIWSSVSFFYAKCSTKNYFIPNLKQYSTEKSAKEVYRSNSTIFFCKLEKIEKE